MVIDKTPSQSSSRPRPPPGPSARDDASSVVSYRTDSPVADQGGAHAASARASSGRNSAGANTRIDNARDAQDHASAHSATASSQDRSNAQAGAGAQPTNDTHLAMPVASNPLPRLPTDRLRENAQAGPSEPPIVRPSVYSGPMWQHEPAHRVATPPRSILVGGSSARANQPDAIHRPQSGASTVDEGYTTAATPRRAQAQRTLEHIAEQIERFHTPYPSPGSQRHWPEERLTMPREEEQQHTPSEQSSDSDAVPGMCGECLRAQYHTPTCPSLQRGESHFIPRLPGSSGESSWEESNSRSSSGHGDAVPRASNHQTSVADEPDDPFHRATPASSSMPSVWTTPSPHRPSVQQRTPSPDTPTPRRRTSSRRNAAAAAPPPVTGPPPQPHMEPVTRVYEPQPPNRTFGRHRPVIPDGVSLRDDYLFPSPPPSPPRPRRSSAGSNRTTRARPADGLGYVPQYPYAQQYQQWNPQWYPVYPQYPQQPPLYLPAAFFAPPSGYFPPPPPLPNYYPAVPAQPHWPAPFPWNYPNTAFHPPHGSFLQGDSPWPLPDNLIAAAAALRMGRILPHPVPGQMGYVPPDRQSPDRSLPLVTPMISSDNGNMRLSDAMAYVPAQSVGQQPTMPGSTMVLIRCAHLSISPFTGPRLHHTIMPNPERPDVPLLKWDVRTPSTLAQRITSSERILPCGKLLQDALTDPEVKEVQISYTMCGTPNLFGPIHIRQTRTVTIGDALDRIYEFFQTPLREDQVAPVQRARPEIWKTWLDAFRLRCHRAPHIAIPEAEWQQGMRRVDCLSEKVNYWGAWNTHNPDRSWQINLGLVAPSELAPHCRGP